MTRTLSCPNCSQAYRAIPPSSNLTKPTLEPCDFPDYDFPQTGDCENCHKLFTIYWHNPGLERKHLLEVKQLLFLKNQYTAVTMGELDMLSKLRFTGEFMLLGRLSRSKNGMITGEQWDDFKRCVQDFKVGIEEFKQMKLDSLELTPQEIQRFNSETQRNAKLFSDEFL